MSEIIIRPKIYNKKPEYLLLRGCINGITLLIPKKAFDDCGSFNTSLRCTQDYDMWHRMLKKYNFLQVEDFLSKTRVTASVVIFTVFSVFSALYFGVSRLRNHTDCVASSMNFPVTDVSTRKSLSVSTVMRKFLPETTLLFNASGCVTAISLSSSLTLLIKMRAAK